ncbi:hypothetical protein GOF53_21300 [Salmonella enterica]|nr:hypothetical protein [Salmonella enterica]EFV2159214.1 hypothetical protein [Salmonella enterica]
MKKITCILFEWVMQPGVQHCVPEDLVDLNRSVIESITSPSEERAIYLADGTMYRARNIRMGYVHTLSDCPSPTPTTPASLLLAADDLSTYAEWSDYQGGRS